MSRARIGPFLSIALLFALSACSAGKSTTTATTSTPRTTTTTNGAPVVVRGHLELDGAPFDAKFLGAIVRNGGLLTPCQGALPPVTGGNYEIPVLAAKEGSGCGEPGADILLWTYVNDGILYGRSSVPWPDDGRTVTFDTSFAKDTPGGLAHPTSQFAGEVYRADNSRMPPGTRVEAFVGDTRCGRASVRRSGDFTGFSLDVVGPELVPGCTRGATLTFQVNGRPARETAKNERGDNDSFDLFVP